MKVKEVVTEDMNAVASMVPHFHMILSQLATVLGHSAHLKSTFDDYRKIKKWGFPAAYFLGAIALYGITNTLESIKQGHGEFAKLAAEVEDKVNSGMIAKVRDVIQNAVAKEVEDVSPEDANVDVEVG